MRTRYGRSIPVDFDPTKGSEQAGHRPAVVRVLSCTTTKQVCAACPYTRNQKDIRSKLFYPVRNVMA
ncbi:type II toxin-antitoxin system PemK/MazF family toxin [Escherichia coli]